MRANDATDSATTQEGARRIAILMYHSLDASGSVVSIAPEQFTAQMALLQEHGLRGITLRQALNHREQSGEWPAKCVVLTFDDGFANNHAHALPLLARHGFAATVFVVTRHVGRRNDWAPPPEPLGLLPLMDWSQLGELTSAGWEIAAHTHTHPDLSSLDRRRAEEEMHRSQREIEDHLYRPAESFAYPFGKYSRTTVRLAADRFRASCTTVLKWAGSDRACLLPRIDAYYLRVPGRFASVVLGGGGYYLTLRRWGRALRAQVSR